MPALTVEEIKATQSPLTQFLDADKPDLVTLSTYYDKTADRSARLQRVREILFSANADHIEQIKAKLKDFPVKDAKFASMLEHGVAVKSMILKLPTSDTPKDDITGIVLDRLIQFGNFFKCIDKADAKSIATKIIDGFDGLNDAKLFVNQLSRIEHGFQTEQCDFLTELNQAFKAKQATEAPRYAQHGFSRFLGARKGADLTVSAQKASATPVTP